MSDLEAARLAFLDGAAQNPERLQEKRFDEVRLEAPGFGALHVLPDLPDLGSIHAVVGQRTFFEKLLAVFAVSQVVDDLMQAGLDLGPVTVPDRLDEQVAEPLLAEQLAQNVEDASAKGLPLQLDLFEEALVHVALARLFRQQVPEMADLGLPDAVNAPEPLFQTVWIPGQVVVDHQMRALKVDALAGGVGGQQDENVLVLFERLLGFGSLLAAHPAVNGDERLGSAKESAEPLGQIVQRIAVLGEDDHLAAMALRIEHLGVVLQERRKLLPFLVCSAAADL